MKRSSLGLLVMVALLSACTKKAPQTQNAATPSAPSVDPANAIHNTDGDKVIFETVLELPKKYASKVRKDDVLVWDVKTKDGQIVALWVDMVPKFPHQVVVRARNLIQPVAKDASFIFSARIMKASDRSKPPQKGQLHIMIGQNDSNTKEEGKPAVSAKVLEKFEKKLDQGNRKLISVGEKTKAQFEPILF